MSDAYEMIDGFLRNNLGDDDYAEFSAALYSVAAAGAASEWNDFVEIACARIKSADDAAADGDYMLDSSDCIKVLRGTWGGNYLNDHPVLPAAGAAPVREGWQLVPVEPTPLMCAEGLEDEGCTVKDGKRFARALYSAMLKAAPKEQV